MYSDVEKLLVIPDIQIISSQKKAITWGEPEQVTGIRHILVEMSGMLRVEEVRRFRKGFAAPDVPAARSGRGGMAEAVDRLTSHR